MFQYNQQYYIVLVVQKYLDKRSLIFDGMSAKCYLLLSMQFSTILCKRFDLIINLIQNGNIIIEINIKL